MDNHYIHLRAAKDVLHVVMRQVGSTPQAARPLALSTPNPARYWVRLPTRTGHMDFTYEPTRRTPEAVS